MNINPMLLTDFYKIGHPFQYPPGTEYIYSNFTPRKSRHPHCEDMVWFGLQAFCLEYLIKYFNENFFDRHKDVVLAQYKELITETLGGIASYQHIEDLHNLGYLPIRIKALKEGTFVPMRIPCMTIVNTNPKFFWVTNFLETLMSCCLWQACTSATIAAKYREVLNKYGKATGMPADFIQWQGHDFSFRGLSSPESAIISGMGHLLAFTGTDTIPAITGLKEYYGGTGLIGASVPATEHSVMCAGGAKNEFETYKRLITEVYPSGIVSIVSDTWDLWHVTDAILPALKDEIMTRDGKVVIRPDSGDPVEVSVKLVEKLWDVFGGTETDKGYRVLDPHIGAIYGDSITIDRAEKICQNLMAKGYASQVVFGIGSYTYQANTRDTFGTAIKATWAQVNGKAQNLFKDPVTDDGTKKSATGLLQVIPGTSGIPRLVENVTPEQETWGLLETVFEDGKMVRTQTLAEIRAIVEAELRQRI